MKVPVKKFKERVIRPFKENKKGWIVLFIIIVVIPLIILTVIGILFSFGKPLLLISLGMFYFYFFQTIQQYLNRVKIPFRFLVS